MPQLVAQLRADAAERSMLRRHVKVNTADRCKYVVAHTWCPGQGECIPGPLMQDRVAGLVWFWTPVP